MRRVLIAAAAVAACGAIATTSAFAEPQHQAGGPNRIGNMCKVTAGDDDNYGYYKPCPQSQQVKAVKPRKKKS